MLVDGACICFPTDLYKNVNGFCEISCGSQYVNESGDGCSPSCSLLSSDNSKCVYNCAANESKNVEGDVCVLACGKF